MTRNGWFLPTALVLGLLFLYGPIVSVVVYSFNESTLVTVWSGFSTKWYDALLQDDAILSAAKLSLIIAVSSATGALVIGTLSGYVLARFRRFAGRTLFAGMVMAPLVMPEIILGISLLLLFVGLQDLIGWPARGMQTIIIAHITFTAAFVAVVVQSRLVDTDISVEEAAADLGAKPVQVFFLITLPLMAPALLAGWLLAFSLSLDDLVTTSFVSGPGSTTLPQLIFSKVKLGLNPEINALATVVITLVSIATFVAAIYQARRRPG
jgi:putrescine transport system permease protein